MLNPDKLNNILEEVRHEAGRACSLHAPMNSLHEAYAVILEEMDELWDEVKKNHRKHPDRDRLARIEARQVAAMAIRLIHDLL